MTQKYIQNHFKRSWNLELTEIQLADITEKVNAVESIFEKVILMDRLKINLMEAENRKKKRMKKAKAEIQLEPDFNTFFNITLDVCPVLKKKKEPFPFTITTRKDLPIMSL